MEWAARMLTVMKKNGKIRRVIDFRHLNKSCKRTPARMLSPTQLIKGFKPTKYYATIDCWQAFHSIELVEEDRDYTTFTTQWGYYRYKRAPQGFLSSTDAYNMRMDVIMQEFEEFHKRCVDDIIVFGNTKEEIFTRTCRIIEKLGKCGVILNEKKFQFAVTEVEFAGYNLTQTSLGLSDKLFSSVTDYPQPKTVKQMRGWIGLLNSLANHTKELAKILNPLRHHICISNKNKKKTLDWTEEDTKNFKKCKETVIGLMRNKIKHFVLGKPLALITDWSIIGSGFILKKKNMQLQG